MAEVDMQNFFENPFTQFGLGVLGANRPGVSFGQAIGQGGMTAMEQMQKLQDRKESAAYRKLQSEQLQAQIRKIREDALAQEELDRRVKQFTEANPQYADLHAIGGADALAGVLSKGFDQPKPPTSYQEYMLGLEDPGYRQAMQTKGSDQPKLPTSYQEYMLGMEDPGYRQAMEARHAASKNYNVKMQTLSQAVTTDMQTKVIESQVYLPKMRRLYQDMKMLPEASGRLGALRAQASGVTGQLADQGLPLFGGLSRILEPSRVVPDQDAPGGQRTISWQTVQSDLNAMYPMIRQMVSSGVGMDSKQTRDRIETAMAMVGSADNKMRLAAMDTLMKYVEQSGPAYEQYLRESGQHVPGGGRTPELDAAIKEAFGVLLEDAQ